MPTRKDILEMLSAGEIDVTRATEMLASAQDTPEPVAPPKPVVPLPVAPPDPAPRRSNGPRWLHVHVSDLDTGKHRVRVNVPLGLVNFGLKVGARFTNEIDNELIHDVMDAFQNSALTGTLVEVEDVEDNERVHIFLD
jgi:hypothetical protein